MSPSLYIFVFSCAACFATSFVKKIVTHWLLRLKNLFFSLLLKNLHEKIKNLKLSKKTKHEHTRPHHLNKINKEQKRLFLSNWNRIKIFKYSRNEITAGYQSCPEKFLLWPMTLLHLISLSGYLSHFAQKT